VKTSLLSRLKPMPATKSWAERVLDMAYEFGETNPRLDTDDIVDVGCLQCLSWKSEGLPSAENNREIRVPWL